MFSRSGMAKRMDGLYLSRRYDLSKIAPNSTARRIGQFTLCFCASFSEELMDRPIDRRPRNWESARIFLEVSRSGSFRSAAQALNLSVNTLRRQIASFEHEVGVTLFTRHVDGIRLTAEGELLIEAAQRMEAASFDMARMRQRNSSMHGELHLSVTEGLGTFWLAPRLVEFQRRYPSLLIDMRCAMRPADVLRLETDIGIQITRPTAGDLHIVKLGSLHAMLFASREYLDTHGCPSTLAELGEHRIVLQVADQLVSQKEFARLFPDKSQVGTVSFRANVSSALYWIIAHGGGIGVLPTYAMALAHTVVPVDIEGVRFVNDIWLAYHPDAAKIARIRRLIDWLIEAFSTKKYPWFGDEFIHPMDFPETVDGHPLPSLFGGFDEVPP